MEAYRLNEFDFWAANSFEEAAQKAVEDTEILYEDIIDEMYASDQPLDRETPVENMKGELITAGEAVDQMEAPGFVFGYRYE